MSTNELPRIAQKSPCMVEVQEGKTYYWCSCGLSKSQPFCDGSHVTTSFQPVEYHAQKTKMVAFCACKHSGRGHICDGSHSKL
jgi:CDGSH-type Zn-finger protein